MDLSFLSVPGIDAATIALLGLASFCTALIGMLTGAGGGPILLALMALVLPPVILIPVHTVVQLGVSVSRIALLRSFIMWKTVLPFVVGGVLGAAAGAPIFVSLPGPVLLGLIGAFVLLIAWMPKFGLIGPEEGRFGFVGFIATFLGMFVSSTGLLIAPFVAGISPDRRNYAATVAALGTTMHLIKLAAFGFIGFSIGAYLPLIAVMCATAALGNWVGRHILVRMPEKAFRIALKYLLTVLSVRLLWVAMRDGGVFWEGPHHSLCALTAPL
jgi:uncharacterized membrane protein YfcA